MRQCPRRTRLRRVGVGALVVGSLVLCGGTSTLADPPDQPGATGAKPNFGPVPANPNANRTPDVPGLVGGVYVDDAMVTVPQAIPGRRLGATGRDLRAAVANGTTTRVTVMTRTPTGIEAGMSAAAVHGQRQVIASDVSAVAHSLEGTRSKRVRTFKAIPAAVFEVDADGLERLLADPRVASIAPEQFLGVQLDVSTSLIDSDQLNRTGVIGNGFDGSPVTRWDVAIIDSGVDNQHYAFSGHIVSQACFVFDRSCPNGTNEQIGGAAGDECHHSIDCGHGSHVAGIAAGGRYPGGHVGVARGAGIVAIQVGSDNVNGEQLAVSTADIDAALQHVYNLRRGSRPNIRSLNLSLGTPYTFADGAACDNFNPSTNALMAQLRGVGVASVVSAGNGGSQSGLSWPACLSNALAVGATDDTDTAASFSNSGPGLEYWAPGVSIEAPVPTSTNEASKTGTSMSAPHVAGAFALLSECVNEFGDPLGLKAKISVLKHTGASITRNGVTRKRINVRAAAGRTVNNNDFADAETIAAAGGVNDFDFNVCADWETNEPGPYNVENSVWWKWTPSATGDVTISTNDGGGNATTFDTTLTVFTGSKLGSLVPKVWDDDSGVGTRSRVTLRVKAGMPYRIRVDGYDGANGLLNLHVSAISR